MVNKGMTMTGVGAMTVGVLALVVVYTIIPIAGSQLDLAISIPGDAYSVGTFTFSGNVSNGELVNITEGSNVYRFEFNTTGNPNLATVLTANAIRVNVSDIGGWNDSIRASGNLTTAINANASTAALLTAANTTNTTTLTADAVGSGGDYTLSDNAANIASSGMTGGATGSQWNSTTNTNLPTAVDFWEALGSIIKVGGVIVVVGGFLTTLKGLRS